MNTRSKIFDATFYVSLIGFIVFAYYVLNANQEVFYAAHSRSEFLYGSPFFHTLMAKPFGLMQYVGAWLTQFFYHPMVGTGVLLAIWLLIFLVGIKAFRLQKYASALMLLPVACLLASVVDTGYWLYISTIRGYWFSQSVAYLVMLLFLWAARCTPRKWHLVWYLIGFCLYPVLGWLALLFVLCLALTERPTWSELISVIVVLTAAPIWRALLYSNLNYGDIELAGLPRFVTPSDKTDHLTLPFWVLGAVSMLISLCGRYLAKFFVPVLCAVAGITFISSLQFSDKNYIDEMRMVRYAEDGNWQEVLKVFADNSSPTTTMVMLKNVALMNGGGLLDRSFMMGNDSHPIYNPDSLHVSFLEIASPLVYYNYGINNEAIRLSYECGVQAGFSPFYLKMLTRCALANGDKKLMERFTTQLHRHPYYGDWQPNPVTPIIKELGQCYPDEITGVENSDSYLVNTISLWSESDSKIASEQALLYSMLRCDSRRFWLALRNFVKLHQNEQFPVHAQEAYIMFMDKAPEKKRMMLPVEQSVYERYKQFWEDLTELAKPGMKVGEIGEKMRKKWGDTYWYYNLFGRKIY
ncbi:MAG: hypothetical protein K2M96_02320 [Prevotella sp.]|nr:hypothetical protein [Prevotella sp.]